MGLFDRTRAEDVSLDDVLEMVEQREKEGPGLDYQLELPGRGPRWKRKKDRAPAQLDFLRDVGAMANTEGGWLVYGVSEEKDSNGDHIGYPQECVGVSDHHGLESECRRLEDYVRNHISPRLDGFSVQPFRKSRRLSRGPVFVARVPRGWSGPRMVTLENASEFNRRGPNGRYTMSHEEVRLAFSDAESLFQKARGFRARRAGAESGWPSLDAAAWVLHVVSLPALAGSGLPGIVIDAIDRPPRLMCRAKPEAPTVPNFAGALVPGNVRPPREGGAAPPHPALTAYVQVYRAGAIEAFDCLAHLLSRSASDYFSFHFDPAMLAATSPGIVRECVEEAVSEYLEFLARNGGGPPYVVMLTLDHADKAQYDLPRVGLGRFCQDCIPIPEFVLESAESLSARLDPVFDVLAQSAGFRDHP